MIGEWIGLIFTLRNNLSLSPETEIVLASIHLRTSTSDKAAAALAEKFSEQMLTPAASLVVTPSHGDPLALLHSTPSEAETNTSPQTHTLYSHGDPTRTWEEKYAESFPLIFQMWRGEKLLKNNSSLIPWYNKGREMLLTLDQNRLCVVRQIMSGAESERGSDGEAGKRRRSCDGRQAASIWSQTPPLCLYLLHFYIQRKNKQLVIIY